MTDVEVAQLLRKHPRTIQRWAHTGVLPGAYKAGRSWRIPRSALMRANLRPRHYGDHLLMELKAARDAIENAPHDLPKWTGIRTVERELLALHDANVQLGKRLTEARRRSPLA